MSDIKIRTIPRSNEKAKQPAPTLPEAPAPSRTMARVFMGLSISVFILAGLAYWHGDRSQVQRNLARLQPSAMTQTDRLAASVTRHTYNTHAMEEMRKRQRQLENLATAPKKGDNDLAAQLPDDNRSYGVQMDQENTAERLYQELNSHPGAYGNNLDERINARLANRKWLNEMERAERIAFVRNFIREAYERGYEVELDQNLIVTRVKKLTNRKVTIDQVLDRLAKQGQ